MTLKCKLSLVLKMIQDAVTVPAAVVMDQFLVPTSFWSFERS